MNQTNSDDGPSAVAIPAPNATEENATQQVVSVPLSNATNNSTDQTVNATSVGVVEISANTTTAVATNVTAEELVSNVTAASPVPTTSNVTGNETSIVDLSATGVNETDATSATLAPSSIVVTTTSSPTNVPTTPTPSTISQTSLNTTRDDAVLSQLTPLTTDGMNATGVVPNSTMLQPSALALLVAGGGPLPEDPAEIRPLLVEQYDATTPSGDRRFACELGYICNDHERVRCSDLQLLHQMQGFGNIHAGLWCPYGVDQYMNCPVGFYCPDPVTKTQCPEGMFCPHKTAVPAIQCRYCKAGAVALTAVPGGIVVFGVLCTLILCFVVYRVVRKYREEQVTKWMALVERRVDSIRIEMNRLRKQKELDGIKPQLDLISKRLADINGGGGGNVAFPMGSGKAFDVRRLFDEIDANHDGVLSYEELNSVLQLGEIQLREFVRRMNTMGEVDRGLTTVSRSLFCRHFIGALTQTSHFRPTMEEAATLFDNIATLAVTNKQGDIDSVTFFKTPYLGFLTDPQVNDLLVRLRKCQNKRMGGYGNSLIGSARSLGMDSTHHSRGYSRNAIQRQSFIENYPRVLLQVVAAPVELPSISERTLQTGVDITFENLSLTVKVNQKATNVVDGVTGRLRRGTMVRCQLCDDT